MKKIIVALGLVVFSAMVAYAAVELVMFNVESHKFHNVDCQWAKKCTKNCIKIGLDEAIKRGGVPCKVCR